MATRQGGGGSAPDSVMELMEVRCPGWVVRAVPLGRIPGVACPRRRVVLVNSIADRPYQWLQDWLQVH